MYTSPSYLNHGLPFLRGLDDVLLSENLTLEQEHYEILFSVCDLDAIKFLKTQKRNKVERKLLAMHEIQQFRGKFTQYELDKGNRRRHQIYDRTIREYNNAIDSNYQHYDFVTLFDTVAIAAKLSNPLRPSKGLILKDTILFIRSREKSSPKVNYIIRNLNKGLQDRLRQQLEDYAKFGYCTGAILSEVLTL